MNAVTIIVRFGDLGIEDAIKAHQTIISNDEYAWGGWWADPNETLPLTTKLESFQQTVKQYGKDIFLFNRETEKLYSVKVIDLKYSNKKIESPEKNKTPNYYRDTPLYLWYKMETIDGPIENDQICQYACCDYSDEDKTSKDAENADNNNVFISSPYELFEQERRSLFFIRKLENNESKIKYTTKKSLSRKYDELKGNSILLLSDLHFSDDENDFVFNDCKKIKKHSLKSLPKAVYDTLDKYNSDDIVATIMAGDLTQHGAKTEYDNVEKFITNLFNVAGIHVRYKRLLIVPGNHDINFNNKDENTITNADEAANKSYKNFYKNIFKTDSNEFMATGLKLILKNKLPVDIVGLNSIFLEQRKGSFQGMGFVGRPQIEMIENEMKWRQDNNYTFRILVLHHHIFPVEYIQEPELNKGYSTCLDAGLLTAFIIRNKINLVIHGHKHKEHYLRIGQKINNEGKMHYYSVLGLGSASSAEKGTNVSNSIAVVDFNDYGFASIKVYEIKTDDSQNTTILLEDKIPVFSFCKFLSDGYNSR